MLIYHARRSQRLARAIESATPHALQDFVEHVAAGMADSSKHVVLSRMLAYAENNRDVYDDFAAEEAE